MIEMNMLSEAIEISLKEEEESEEFEDFEKVREVKNEG
jgi:hypothetical protein